MPATTGAPDYIPVVPGGGSQDGDESQTGAEEDPAADVEDGVLAAPPDEGPQVVGTVVRPGQAGLLPRPPGHQAPALALAPLGVPVEILLVLAQSLRLEIVQFYTAGRGNLVLHTTQITLLSLKINKENLVI